MSFRVIDKLKTMEQVWTKVPTIQLPILNFLPQEYIGCQNSRSLGVVGEYSIRLVPHSGIRSWQATTIRFD
ncbi:hypothetical protein JW766_01400 [Candidatus Dojkabacteria bacterium]|nr:hypothetical protein [Candidatus Dojkabacteria bacterium]